jgi:hypothetical protein
MPLDKVCDYFGIRLRQKSVAFVLQFLFEGQIVFDDSIVDNDNITLAVAMGMGVFLCRAAVRGPACMSDAIAAVDRTCPDDLFQVAQLPGCTPDTEFPICQHRYAG